MTNTPSSQRERNVTIILTNDEHTTNALTGQRLKVITPNGSETVGISEEEYERLNSILPE